MKQKSMVVVVKQWSVRSDGGSKGGFLVGVGHEVGLLIVDYWVCDGLVFLLEISLCLCLVDKKG